MGLSDAASDRKALALLFAFPCLADLFATQKVGKSQVTSMEQMLWLDGYRGSRHDT